MVRLVLLGVEGDGAAGIDPCRELDSATPRPPAARRDELTKPGRAEGGHGHLARPPAAATNAIRTPPTTV